ncbi:MAG: hypothetical protein ACOY4K_12165 [Pseudomonadota bacterium]
MRLVSFLAAVAGLFLTGAARQQPVDITLSPVIGKNGLEALKVEMRAAGEADGETTIVLPDRWASETDLMKHVSDLEISGGTASAPSPSVRVIKHKPGAALIVRYRLTSGYDGDPPHGNPYRPIVRPGWFHILGEAGIATPEWDDRTPAHFHWKNWPKTWTLASDLEHAARGRPLTLGAVRESVTVGATDLRIVTRPVEGGMARVALRGVFAFDDAAFADTLGRIVSAQRRFWGGVDGPYFISLIPTVGGEGVISLGGTGRGDAFALFATPNTDLPRFRFLIAHEHTHAWVPRQLGRMLGEDQGEANDYWFSEGFTDFYTYRTLAGAGLWSLEDYAAELNRVLTAYDRSTVRAAPNSRILTGFWADPEVKSLPYQRGMLLAFWWDARVRAATGGTKDLDDVLRLMMQRRNAAEAGGRPVAFVRPAFVSAIKDVAGLDIGADIDRYVEAGEPVALPPEAFACLTIKVEQRRVFDRGWDPEATTNAGNIITGLRPDSPAYAAGLREGMKIVRREAGRPGDAGVEYVMRVLDGETERVFGFMPEGKGRYLAREVAVPAGLTADAREACAGRLGGE